jgi:isopentenyl-diphosphate delta-isomerase
VLLLANLGVTQLFDYGAADCARLVEMCEADALALHVNAVHEAMQVRGHTEFRGVLAHIEKLCAQLDVPVVVKEVGFGLSSEDAAELVAAGVGALDVAGAGAPTGRASKGSGTLAWRPWPKPLWTGAGRPWSRCAPLARRSTLLVRKPS